MKILRSQPKDSDSIALGSIPRICILISSQAFNGSDEPVEKGGPGTLGLGQHKGPAMARTFGFPKIPVGIITPSAMLLGGEAFRRGFNHEGGSPRKGISVLLRGTPQSPPAPSTM